MVSTAELVRLEAEMSGAETKLKYVIIDGFDGAETRLKPMIIEGFGEAEMNQSSLSVKGINKAERNQSGLAAEDFGEAEMNQKCLGVETIDEADLVTMSYWIEEMATSHDGYKDSDEEEPGRSSIGTPRQGELTARRTLHVH